MRLRNLLAVGLPLAASLYIVYFNPIEVPLRLSARHSVRAPLPLLLVFAALAGAVVALAFDLGHRVRKGLGRVRTSLGARRRRRWEEGLRRARGRLRAGEVETARAALRRLARRPPGDAEALLSLGDLLREAGDSEGALSLHLRAAAGREVEPETLMSLVRDFEAAGRSEELERLLEGAIERGGIARAPLRKLRDHYVAAGRWEDAHRVQQRLGGLRDGAGREGEGERKKVARIRFEVGRARAEGGDAAGAIQHLESAVQADPAAVAPQVALGEAYLALGRPRRAVRLWERAFGRTHSFVFLQRLADYHARSGRPDRAVSLLREAAEAAGLEGTRQAVRAGLLLAVFLLREGKSAEALQELDRLARGPLEPGALFFHHLLVGRACLDGGDRERAAAAVRAASGHLEDQLLCFRCGVCGSRAEEWRASCPHCGSWDSIDLGSPGG
ncbi:MAG: tetratricopeptide repeat protein, partial [Nitrospinota bacterium]